MLMMGFKLSLHWKKNCVGVLFALFKKRQHPQSYKVLFHVQAWYELLQFT